MITLNEQDWKIVDLLAAERWRINRANKHVKNFRNFQPHLDFEEIERRALAGEMAFAKHVGIWFPTSQDPAVRVNEPDLYFGGRTIDVKTTWNNNKYLNLSIKEWEDTKCEVYLLMFYHEVTRHFYYIGYALQGELVTPENWKRGKVFDGYQAPDYYSLPESHLIKSLP